MRKCVGMVCVLFLMTLAGAIGLPSRAVARVPDCGAGSGNVKDEALCVGRTADSFPAADDDYFRDMDNGATKDRAALRLSLIHI